MAKVAAVDSGGQCMLMEDHLKANFRLGFRKNRCRAETFHVLEGSVDFLLDGDWMAALNGKHGIVNAGPVPERRGIDC